MADITQIFLKNEWLNINNKLLVLFKSKFLSKKLKIWKKNA